MNDTLPRSALLRLLAVLTLVLAPHVVHLPLWANLLVVALLVWRALAAFHGWRMLPRLFRIILTFAAFGGVFASFGRVSGQTAGVALLVVMVGLKLTELRTRRDVMVLVFLMYFLLITHFLFSQELWTAAYLVICAIAITGVLVDANHPGGALPLRTSLRFGSRLVIGSLPLMVVIFILFPRIPGPLWGLPSDSGAARSACPIACRPAKSRAWLNPMPSHSVCDSMARPPPNRERYWRGPVFGHFDGRRWDAVLHPPQAAGAPQAEFDGPSYRYEVTLEPQRSHWLFALDLPLPKSLPADAALGADFQLLAKDEVRERRLYTIESFTRYRLQDTLDPAQQAFYLHLPPKSNPRTQALGQQWRAQGLDAAQIVDAGVDDVSSAEFRLHAAAATTRTRQC